jgi:hypothetical protein
MTARETGSILIVVLLSVSFSSFMAEASNSTLFYGVYRATAYNLNQPSTDDYSMTVMLGGTVQTYYGVFANTTLERRSDVEFTGIMGDYSASIKLLDAETHYDEQERMVSDFYHSVITLDDQVQSTAMFREYGNYSGIFLTKKEMLEANMDDVWNYSYEARSYENGNYKETLRIAISVTAIDFPTKVVAAGSFSTLHIEQIQSTDGVQDNKYNKYYDLQTGTLVYLESYDWSNGKWVLLMKRELMPNTEPIQEQQEGFLGTNLPNEYGYTIIAGVVAVIAVSAGVIIYRRKHNIKESQSVVSVGSENK